MLPNIGRSRVEDKWISSGGGPYICTTLRQANRWKGVESLSLPIDKPAYKKFDRSYLLDGYENTDYGWTAVIRKDFAFKLPGQENDIVVISDLPSDLMCLQHEQDEFSLVKWVGADSAAQVREHLMNLDVYGYVKLNFDIAFNEPNVAVFDSAWSLHDIKDNFIEMKIAAGVYFIYNRIYRPDDSIELHVLRFIQSSTSQAMER